MINVYRFIIALIFINFLVACSGSSTPQATVTASTQSATANSKTVATTLNTAITITLKSSGAKGYLFRVMGQPSNGTLVGDLSGSIVTVIYTPVPSFSGDDSFVFEVTDADGNVSSGKVTVQVLASSDPQADTDKDGLTDLLEINQYGTNPNLADTDGDGFSDFYELVDLGFNATVNNYRFNPLIADTPEVDVQIASTPDIRVNYTLTDGTSKTVGTSRSQTSSQSVSTSKSESQSTTVSESHTASVEISSTVSVSAEVGLFSPPKAETEASVTATAGYSYENTTTNEQSTSWSREQTQENSSTLEQSESLEQNNSVAASDGEISIAVNIINNGHISYTLNNLFLSATYIRPRGVDPLVPVGNLAFDASGGSFPNVTLSPGQSTGTLVFRGKGVNLAKIKDILANSRGFSVRPTLYNLLDQDNVPYNFASTAVVSNDAMILVDFNGNNALPNISKMVAVNGVSGQQITVADALNKVLKINMATTTDTNNNTYINSVDGLENVAPKGIWLMIHAKQRGNNLVDTKIYTTPDDKVRWQARNANVKNLVANYDPATIKLGAGDVIDLIYLQDSDLDGLSNRMEYYYKSDPKNPDTDSDGLADGVEAKDGWKVAYQDKNGANIVRKVYSNPILTDSDFDGRDDKNEANLSETDDHLRLDPTRFDTDNDGLDDLIDDYSASTGKLINEYDDLSISSVTAAANIPVGGSAPYDVKVGYTLPSIIANAGSNGITEYTVVALRYKDSSGLGDFPVPSALKDGFSYLTGDSVPCDNQQPGCSWQVVAVTQPALNVLPGTISFTDSALLYPEVPGVSPADVAKYVFYVGVNGRYTRQSVEKLASSKTETLEIHMVRGSFNNVRTVFSTSTTMPGINAAETRLFSWINNGGPVYFDFVKTQTGTNGAYNAYDGSGGIAGNIIGSYSMPYSLMRPGDGRLDVSWYLYADGNRLNSDPVAYPISKTFDNYWASGAKNNIPAAIDKNGTFDNDMFVNGYGANGTMPTTDSDGNAVFTITVPAVPGDHTIELFIKEYDYARNAYNTFVSPPDLVFPNRPDQGYDAIRLHRDEQGIWSAAELDINTSQVDTGRFVGGANVTRKGNINPIKYTTRTIKLSDMDKPGSTTMQTDFDAQFNIFVR